MFEAERMLLAEVPFVPIYTYVTKRMVNPRLSGWASNVMDHHYSKNMYLLKAASNEPSAVIVDQLPTEAGEAEISVELEPITVEPDAGVSAEDAVTETPAEAPVKEQETIVTEAGDAINPGDPDK